MRLHDLDYKRMIVSVRAGFTSVREKSSAWELEPVCFEDGRILDLER